MSRKGEIRREKAVKRERYYAEFFAEYERRQGHTIPPWWMSKWRRRPVRDHFLSRWRAAVTTDASRDG